MKPIGWTLLLIGLVLVCAAVAVQVGLVVPWGLRERPSPALIGLVGLLLLAAGYGATRMSRR